MPTEIKIPAAGDSITTAAVAQWHKSDGEPVSKGDVLVTIETDKVSTELECEADGVLKILVPEGKEVAIGTVIAEVDESAAPAPAPPAQEERSERGADVPPAQEDPAPPAKPEQTEEKELAPAPAPEKLAAPPASPDGRVTRRKMSMLRRKVADHLVNAQHEAAILTTFNEVDMSAVMELRKAVQESFVAKHGVKLGFMSFFVKAVVQALQNVPQINGRIEGQEIVQNHYYDIGVAVGTDKGLVVPVLRDCDRKSPARLEQDIAAYAAAAREGKLEIEDLQGGVFTISNGGVYGSLLSTPILNPPQSGILGMHAIQQRPVAVDGEVVIRPMMYLALSYDHRLVDGKEAVAFLIEIKNALESPARLMLGV